MSENLKNSIAPQDLVVTSDPHQKAIGSLKNTMLLTGSFLKRLVDKKKLTEEADIKDLDKALSDLAISVQLTNIMLTKNPSDFTFYKPEESKIITPTPNKIVVP